MNYVVFDLEFNQASKSEDSNQRIPFEIIQIGAVLIDKDFNKIDEFNRYVKPQIYPEMNTFVEALTGIDINILNEAQPFYKVYKEFFNFVKRPEVVFCTWGQSDMKELFRNIKYYSLPYSRLPRKYIDVQKWVSKHLKFPKNFSIGLRDAIRFLGIKEKNGFHNAYNDAYYTWKIFEKTYSEDIPIIEFDPNPKPKVPKVQSQKVDFNKMINQFEKMYKRPLSKDEIEMIKLAYLMGKTGQFKIQINKN